LKGCNGKWKQQKATQLVQERAVLQRALDEQRRAAEEEERRRREEHRAWLQRKHEEEEREKREEALRKAARQRLGRAARRWAALSGRLAEEEAALISRLRQPRPCERCGGSGSCPGCSGLGCLPAMYLAASVGREAGDTRFRGRAVYGCDLCGGARDGREALGLDVSHRGCGFCVACCGAGKTWPSPAEVAALRAQVDRDKRLSMSGA